LDGSYLTDPVIIFGFFAFRIVKSKLCTPSYWRSVDSLIYFNNFVSCDSQTLLSCVNSFQVNTLFPLTSVLVIIKDSSLCECRSWVLSCPSHVFLFLSLTWNRLEFSMWINRLNMLSSLFPNADSTTVGKISMICICQPFSGILSSSTCIRL
jgi:hypothetical protein